MNSIIKDLLLIFGLSILLSATLLTLYHYIESGYAQFAILVLIVASIIAPWVILSWEQRTIVWLIEIGLVSSLLPNIEVRNMSSPFLTVSEFITDNNTLIPVVSFLLASVLAIRPFTNARDDLTKRSELKQKIKSLLSANKQIFTDFGPQSDAKNAPISTNYKSWEELKLTVILPNNRKIVELLEENIQFLSEKDVECYSQFKSHVEGFELNSLSGQKNPLVPQFNPCINKILD